jgi:hypothetical protein
VANGRSNIPEWLTAGVTYRTPKNENTGNPKNYRPVTCDLSAYGIQTYYICYKQMHAEIYG